MGGGLVWLQPAALWTRLIGGSFGNVAHVLALTINVLLRSQCRRDQRAFAIKVPSRLSRRTCHG